MIEEAKDLYDEIKNDKRMMLALKQIIELEKTQMIKVYSKKNCMQCDFTKQLMRDNEIEFEEVTDYDIEDLKAMGFASLPVVVTDAKKWCGFRPELIEELIGHD